MALKFITAEEAASYVHHNDNVGFSGFTPAGYSHCSLVNLKHLKSENLSNK